MFKRLLFQVFFSSCSFTKPLDLCNTPLCLPANHSDPISPHIPILLTAPPQLSSRLRSCSMGTHKSLNPFLSSSLPRALSLIILNLGYTTCIHSVSGNISLAVLVLTELLSSTCTNRILLSLSSPESFPYHALPAAPTHTSPTDMWSVTHKSALKLLSQIQIIWPSTPQSTTTIHLKKQIPWPGIACWRKFLPFFRTQQNF